MRITVNGIDLWFDVEGVKAVPDGPVMRDRATVVLIHGGPGSYDHSYFKPHFSRVAQLAQVVYLDLRGHGRSTWGGADDWSYEVCADDVSEFCDALGLDHPIVVGHSMGGFVALHYAIRHPGHAGGVVIASSFARFDLDRIAEAFRQRGGDRVADAARRSFGGEPVTAEEWMPAFAAFGPVVPDDDTLERRIRNPDLGPRGDELLAVYDVVDRLAEVSSPMLVITGDLDPVGPPAAAHEVIDHLRPGVGSLSILDGAGHFPWLDDAEGFFGTIEAWIDGIDPTLPRRR
jgi:pimeloyl-ACP methyl ester carboxylesterase